MFSYTPAIIHYQKQEFGQNPLFHDIALAIMRMSGKRIIEAGCGLGYLSKELSGLGATVTAVDNNPFVAAQAVYPVLPRDIHTLEPAETYDALVCCNYGCVLEDLELAGTLSHGALFMIRQNWEGHRYQPAESAPNRASQAREMLTSLCIPFTETSLTVESGQRFTDKEDACSFFQAYGNTHIPQLDHIDGPYPLLYHRPGNLSLFCVKTKDIPPLGNVKNLIIAGEQGVGKSTLRLRILDLYHGTLTGFTTTKRDGQVYLDGIGKDIHGVAGKAGERKSEVFDTLGVQALRQKGGLRVMDELGYMENDALLFQEAVLAALGEKTPAICAVKEKMTPFLIRVRSDSHSLTLHLKEENRQAITEELLRAIPTCTKWPFAKAFTRPASL